MRLCRKHDMQERRYSIRSRDEIALNSQEVERCCCGNIDASTAKSTTMEPVGDTFPFL